MKKSALIGALFLGILGLMVLLVAPPAAAYDVTRSTRRSLAPATGSEPTTPPAEESTPWWMYAAYCVVAGAVILRAVLGTPRWLRASQSHSLDVARALAARKSRAASTPTSLE